MEKDEIQVVIANRIEFKDEKIVTLKVKEEIVQCWNRALKRLGFTSRSELIRVAVNEYLRMRGIECASEYTEY